MRQTKATLNITQVLERNRTLFGGARMEAAAGDAGGIAAGSGAGGTSGGAGGGQAGQGGGTGNGDAGQGGGERFEPIRSQEDFDRRITARITREREKYADYDAIKDKAGKYDELDAASKTELQKSDDRATTAEGKVAQLEPENLRLRIALEKSIPADLVDRLKGANRAEIEADADKLLTLVGNSGGGTRFEHGTRTTTEATGMNGLIARQMGRGRR